MYNSSAMSVWYKADFNNISCTSLVLLVHELGITLTSIIIRIQNNQIKYLHFSNTWFQSL